ncbi:MAG: hypothetical protein J7M34_10455 [Anaerolineae bacterium]|nr:hypothetical protein [Anaerolineae bacterium]
MRRREFLLIIIAWVVALGWLSQPTAAAPLKQKGAAVITSPQPFSVVRGKVTIEGTAVHPNFLRYELYYSPEPARDDTWVFIGEAHFNQVANGFLGTWETRALPDGLYSLRLRVVRQDYNYDEYIVRGLQVANHQPTDTPTPAATPTPTMTPTPIPPTPTIVVVAPVISTITPEAAATPTPVAVARASQAATSASPKSTPDILSLRGMIHAFWMGARWSLIAFAVVGAFFGLKALILWAWQQMAGTKRKS